MSEMNDMDSSFDGKVGKEGETERDLLIQKIKNLEDQVRKYTALIEKSPICTKVIDTDRKLRYMSDAGVNGLFAEHGRTRSGPEKLQSV